jgi:hypothetical protein
VALGIVVEKRTDWVVLGTAVEIRLALARSNAELLTACCFCPFTACAYVSCDFVVTSKMSISPTATANMWEEFHEFLIETHGPDWRTALAKYKIHTAERRYQCQTGKRMRGVRKADNLENGTDISPYEELNKDVTSGTDAISRFSDADWWVWKRGLALFF